jgi:hypothetical protein
VKNNIGMVSRAIVGKGAMTGGTIMLLDLTLSLQSVAMRALARSRLSIRSGRRMRLAVREGSRYGRRR